MFVATPRSRSDVMLVRHRSVTSFGWSARSKSNTSGVEFRERRTTLCSVAGRLRPT